MKAKSKGKRRDNSEKEFRIKETTIRYQDHKISHQEILKTSIHFTDLVDLYRRKVLAQTTRTIRLLGRKNSAKIIHTLLGFEVQSCYKRIQCPDLVTARYIKLFSELGCHSIKMPYDPTVTAQVIPEFEAMMASIAKRVHDLFPQDPLTRRYVFQKVFAIIRRQLLTAEKPSKLIP